jgi:hypothetical protein
MERSILLVGVHPANPSVLLDTDEVLDDPRATWLSPSSDLLMWLGHAGSSGKTSPAFCHQAEDGTLVPSSGRWQNSGMGSPTECLTLSTSEFASAVVRVFVVGYLGDWRRAAAVLFERERACAGILRRAAVRYAKLPDALRRGLEFVTTQKPKT